jgi:8-oxo-dGTP pyrophosphatase MutT (NUDIX family)
MDESEPIQTVGVVVLNHSSVLLVKHQEQSDHLTGVYGLPAGKVREGEDFAIAAKRELFEEAGLTAFELSEMPQKYLAEIKRKDSISKLFAYTVFLCGHYIGEVHPGSETSAEWVNVSDLEKYELLPNVQNAIIQALEIKHSQDYSSNTE